MNYCPNCKAEYWPSEDCDCVIYRLNPAVSPSWWKDKANKQDQQQ